MTKREAVQEIKDSGQTAHVVGHAERALADGSDAALTKALVEAAKSPGTAHVENIAKTQLGYKWNGRNYE